MNHSHSLAAPARRRFLHCIRSQRVAVELNHAPGDSVRGGVVDDLRAHRGLAPLGLGHDADHEGWIALEQREPQAHGRTRNVGASSCPRSPSSSGASASASPPCSAGGRRSVAAAASGRTAAVASLAPCMLLVGPRGFHETSRGRGVGVCSGDGGVRRRRLHAGTAGVPRHPTLLPISVAAGDLDSDGRTVRSCITRSP